MRVVSVSELKARLSEYLREVRSGVRLVVTDHATPVAEIASYGMPKESHKDPEEIFRRLAARGSVRLPSRVARFASLKGRARLSGQLASKLLLGDRG